MKENKEYSLSQLSNGVQLVHAPNRSPVGHFGIFLNVGSRDETPEEEGLAHYIEHCLFKGTKNRKAFHVLSRIDAVGGELNAFTTKEYTCVYASFQTEYFERAMELIADIVLHSNYPAKEIVKEKDVIIDEINSYLDSPSEQIFDDFDELLYGNHPLGKNILGTIESVKSFTRNDILQFIRKHYHRENVVLSVAGNIDEKEVMRLSEKHFSSLPKLSSKEKRKPFTKANKFHETIKRDAFQNHVLMGTLAYKLSHAKMPAMVLLNNLLGGPSMNTRLNLGIREKYGFAYNLYSNYTAYTDTGVFSIYLGTDPKFHDKSIELILKELKKLRDKKLGRLQFDGFQKQLIGNMTLGRENMAGLMQANGRTLLQQKRVYSWNENVRKINAITADELWKVANEIFDEKGLSSLTYLTKK